MPLNDGLWWFVVDHAVVFRSVLGHGVEDAGARTPLFPMTDMRPHTPTPHLRVLEKTYMEPRKVKLLC